MFVSLQYIQNLNLLHLRSSKHLNKFREKNVWLLL